MKFMPFAAEERAPAVIREEFAQSADGTRVAYRKLGSGPALVFVHGSISTHTDWMRVARLLASRYTCCTIDRRGRGHSGNGRLPYSLEREYEDIEAVRAQAGPIAALVGHSYGAMCTLGAAVRQPVPKLVLYEPPLNVHGPIAGEFLEPYRQAIAAGDIDGALKIGLPRFTQLSDRAIAALRASKGWPRVRSLAPTWTRELEAMDGHEPSVERYAAIACPVLLLVGELSPEHPMHDASRALAAVLKQARVETIEGYGHMAMRDAPATVARLIANFIGG